MSVTQDQVVDYIKNLKLGEVKALIETLEKELGVKASAPMMAVAAGGGAAQGGANAAPAVEKTEFDVVMSAFGENKIGVIKVVRELTGLGLKEAKALVEAVPAKVKEAISRKDADAAVEALKASGATAEVK